MFSLFEEMLLAARLIQLSTMISLQAMASLSTFIYFNVSSEIFARLLFRESSISKLQYFKFTIVGGWLTKKFEPE